MNVREPDGDYPAHRAWVRLHGCSIPGCDRSQIEAAHVRKGLPPGEQAGMGEKPHDKWCLSLCSAHHLEQHSLGELSFSTKYGLDLVVIAREFAKASPHRLKWESRE